jgi:glycosyltransferase involved in cell wall biosynthesis
VEDQNLVVILDPKGVISREQSTVVRHNLYGDTLNLLNPNFKLVIITKSNLNSFELQDTRSVHYWQIETNQKIPIKFAQLASRILRNNYNFKSLIYVAGDPWESFFALAITRFLVRSKSFSQVQIHAEVANPRWYRMSVKNRARFILARAAFKNADQIRTVSTRQSSDIINRFSVNASKVKVIAPPLQLEEKRKLNAPPRPRTIGFVGRIESDRGVAKLIKLCFKLNEVDHEFGAVVIGSGSKLSSLEKELTNILGTSRTHFFGRLEESSLQQAWNEVGVLVSLSDTESYGRAIREALAMGIPVWSTQTSGFLALLNEYRQPGLAIINCDDEAIKLKNKFDELLSVSIGSTYSKSVQASDSHNVRLLCESWLEISSNKAVLRDE